MPDRLLPEAPDIVRAAYATLVVTDLAEARRFWVGLLGFVVTHEDTSALYLRGYDELTHHNLILRAGPTAAAGALGFRVRSEPDLSRAEAYYAALGCRTERLPAGTVRGLGDVVRVEDPLGFLVDFFASAAHPERLQ
jgi:catechol 2,3-dioxygenase